MAGRNKYSVSSSGCVAVLTLDQLRQVRDVPQKTLAARMGVDASTVSRQESSSNPTIATLDGFVSALGGQLLLLAVFPNPDGTIDKQLIRTADDPRREVPADRLFAVRHRVPRTPRPAKEGRAARLAAFADNLEDA